MHVTGVEGAMHKPVVLFSRQSLRQLEPLRPDRLQRQPGDAGIHRQVAGQVPVVGQASGAACGVQVQDVLEDVFEQRLPLRRREGQQPLRVDAQRRHPVADGDPQRLRGVAPAAPEAEQEMSVKRPLLEQAHGRVFEHAHVF